jgi:uncharacterized membrane protein (DUF4010 family)
MQALLPRNNRRRFPRAPRPGLMADKKPRTTPQRGCGNRRSTLAHHRSRHRPDRKESTSTHASVGGDEYAGERPTAYTDGYVLRHDHRKARRSRVSITAGTTAWLRHGYVHGSESDKLHPGLPWTLLFMLNDPADAGFRDAPFDSDVSYRNPDLREELLWEEHVCVNPARRCVFTFRFALLYCAYFSIVHTMYLFLMNAIITLLAQAPIAETLSDVSLPALFQKGAISLLVGALVGLERERSIEENRILFAGIRTYPLIGLLGFLSALLSYHTNFWILAVLATGFIALVVSSYVLEARAGHHGATSEVAAIIVFILGALIFHEFYAVAIACSVVLTLFLSLKQPLQRLVAHVSEEDIYATLKFAIITAIVLPVLPNQTMGPLDVINPRQVWYMVILIAGISFAGYVLVKVFGSKRGLVITGLLGGLVSSTAVTLSFSQRSREIPDLSRTFASAIILACTIMYPRVLIEIAVVNPALLALMWPYLVILIVAGVTASLLLLFGKRSDSTSEVVHSNPFKLMAAIKFGLIFALILFVARAAQLYLGDGGVYLAAGLAGLTDVDAITLSMANLSRSGAITEQTAMISILIATVVNTIVKAGMAVVLGATVLRRYTLPGFGLVLFTGVAIILWLLL